MIHIGNMELTVLLPSFYYWKRKLVYGLLSTLKLLIKIGEVARSLNLFGSYLYTQLKD
jgi:hypothetical protein